MVEPLISVVIPTYRRALLVKRAVESALSQTLREIEVIVVIDGPHEETRAKLATIDDPRLKVIELPTNQGSRVARNAGVNAASAKWVAFLDDDDEWMPPKLKIQLETANNSQYKFPIISSFVIAWTPQGDTIWPRRIPKQSEPLSEYLFVRNSLFQGEGLIHTSTILTSKELLQKVPFITNFDSDVHDDWDWLLRIIQQEGVGIEFVQQVLSVWNLGEGHTSLSRSHSWHPSLKWIQAKRDLVTPRAYSSFILVEVSARAAYAQEWGEFLPLLWEAIRFGKPQPKDICLYFGMWFLTPDIRSCLRNFIKNKKRAWVT